MSRLEEYGFDIEREMKNLKNIVEKDDSLTISSRFVKYLIQQAERVEELEGRKYRQDLIDEHIERLEQQNQRYKQALEFYADENNYLPNVTEENHIVPVLEDEGNLARLELEKMK